MKSLAVAFSALALILLFWAVVFIAIITNLTPNLNLSFLPTLFDFIKTAGAVATASAAIYALKTWRRTLKAQKRTEFLDQLLTAALEYIDKVKDAVSEVRVVQYYLELHGVVDSKAINSVVAKNGKALSKGLEEILNRAQPTMIKVEALVAKGVVFKFDEYDLCVGACNNLVRIYTEIDLMNVWLRRGEGRKWDGKLEKRIMTMTEDQLNKVVREQEKILIDYVTRQYAELHD